MKKSFKFIDLFAGIGGFRIALEELGGKCEFSSEIDEQCQKMYANYFGDIPHGDITKIKETEIPDHDILCGGFPCQAFSIIGDKKGFADTRGTLFFDIERILKAKKPKAIFLENVKQLVGHDGGKTFNVIKERLQNLGYNVHHKVLNGLDFGVPQKRERIIIVGFLKNHPFEFPDGKSLDIERKSLKDILEDEKSIEEKHYVSEYIAEKLKRQLFEQNKTRPKHPTVWHENKSGNLGINNYSCALRAGGSFNYLLVNGERRPTPREMFRLQGFPDDYEIIVPLTQARKQAGNAVVIPKIKAVGVEILNALNKKPLQKDVLVQKELFGKKRVKQKIS